METEALTPDTDALLRSRGLAPVFAEDVLRFDLARPVPEIAPPAGVRLTGWADPLIPRFHAVYRAAFRERPGFPDPSAAEWAAWTVDDDFQPRHSMLAGADGTDLGFVTGTGDMIIQVGTVPAARGRGIGAALIAEVLRRMRAAGVPAATLDVNVDNPAGNLYRRLGFVDAGRRARYAR